MDLWSARSNWANAGPRRLLRPELPKYWLAVGTVTWLATSVPVSVLLPFFQLDFGA
jgi:hypothetical protein